MGPPTGSQKQFQDIGTDVNDFIPHRTTIHVGDTVRFVPAGFHTVDLPGRRTRPVPLFVPTRPIAGSLDAAGAPFWFNGRTNLGFNPVLGTAAFGKRRTYNGAKAVQSGLPVGNRPRPMTVRFTKAGTFRYFCDVHNGMTGVVRVVRADRRVPSASQDRATVRAQLAATLRTARALRAGAQQTPNTVQVGLQGAGNVSFFGFVPDQLTVPAGTTVTFRSAAPSEVHTATIGPGNPESEPSSYLGQITASLEGPNADPRVFFPSDQPPAIAALTPTFHGNGFWSSGVIDRNPASTPPASNAVTFAGPGTYQVYCLIHPFMHATVTVQ